MSQCIGQRKISNRRNERSQLVRCTNEGMPNFSDHEDWGYLCVECSSQPPHARRQYEEAENVCATQADPLEYKDQIASGFATGARRTYEDEGNNDD